MKGRIAIAVVAVLFVLTLCLRKTSESSARRSQDSELPADSHVPVTRSSVRTSHAIASDATTEPSTNTIYSTNVYARLVDHEPPKLNREQLERFLAKRQRSVDALLGALRTSEDGSFFNEAKERFPDDPRVQLAAAFKSDSPEERRQWLEKLKQSAADNSLPNYLLAGEHFKAGETDQALRELAAAGSRPVLNNYILDFVQNTEEAYRAAGYSDAEAKAIADTSALIPELAPLKQVGVELRDLAKRYEEAGDEAAAQATLQTAVNLAHRLNDSPPTTLIQELVGIAIERIALNAMNPNSPYGESGKTVKEQSDALDERRKGYRELVQKAQPILMQMSDEDVTHYFDRTKLYGEIGALQWVLSQAPRQ